MDNYNKVSMIAKITIRIDPIHTSIKCPSVYRAEGKGLSVNHAVQKHMGLLMRMTKLDRGPNFAGDPLVHILHQSMPSASTNPKSFTITSSPLVVSSRSPQNRNSFFKLPPWTFLMNTIN